MILILFEARISFSYFLFALSQFDDHYLVINLIFTELLFMKVFIIFSKSLLNHDLDDIINTNC